MNSFLYTFLFFIFVSSTKAAENVPQPLCDLDGIREEILKAIQILKIKSLEKPPAPGSKNQLRQDDDDDGDIPYYVPAIAKVVASVLAQNATNVIEESFGFIPPEINQNIRYVLGLVAETVGKLRPTPAPTTVTPVPETVPTTAATVKIPETAVSDTGNLGAPAGVETPVQSEANIANAIAQSANIEEILAYALAQQLISKPTGTTEQVLKAVVETEVTPAVIETTPANAPELFTSTFKYSQGNSVTSGPGDVAISDELNVYAPAYAPNYGLTTTKSPIYASAYDHNVYSPVPPQSVLKSTSPTSVVSLNATTTKIVDESTGDSGSEGTTEDYYDENVTDAVEGSDEGTTAAAIAVTSSSAIKVSNKVTAAISATTSGATASEDEDEYDVDAKDRSIN